MNKKITGIPKPETRLLLLIFFQKLGWVKLLKFQKEENLDYLNVAAGCVLQILQSLQESTHVGVFF